MNVVILQGRLTDDPKVWYGNEGNSVSVARYTLAVDRYLIMEKWNMVQLNHLLPGKPMYFTFLMSLTVNCGFMKM